MKLYIRVKFQIVRQKYRSTAKKHVISGQKTHFWEGRLWRERFLVMQCQLL